MGKEEINISHMDKLTPHLFLGFPVNADFSRLLSEVNPYMTSLFIQEKGDYLQELVFKNGKYLGKPIENITDFSELELLEANIFSILKKLVPNYPYENTPLVLFTVPPRSPSNQQ